MALREAANTYGRSEPVHPRETARLERTLFLRALGYAAVVASTWQMPLRPRHITILRRLRAVGPEGMRFLVGAHLDGPWMDLVEWRLIERDESIRLTAEGAAALALFEATRRRV